MTSEPHVDGAHDLDEGSWVYLSLGGDAQRTQTDLYRRVSEACEKSGWPAVSWSPKPQEMNVASSARYFEGMSHAVEHADAVVVLMDSPSAMTDIELAFAYSHNRPVVGLRIGRQDPGAEIQLMLQRHARGRVIDCADIDDCLIALRKALSDPQFAETIREAASEQADRV
jgi:hypothetical protein